MNETELLRRIQCLTVWQQRDQRAPHKPLLILYSLGRLIRGESQFVRFSDAESDLRKLLERFGPPRKAHHPDQPFKRLQHDQLWSLKLPTELSNKSIDKITRTDLRQDEVRGGFAPEVFDLLQNRRDLIETVASHLLDSNFPPSYHDEIRRQVGIEVAVETQTSTRPRRDPRFRENVLRAYGRICAVCGSDLRLDDALFDLDAAHIKWHAAGGPDKVSNGLALCGFHHRSFDRGVWALDPTDESFEIRVSSGLNGQSQAVDLLLDFEHKKIRVPRDGACAPNRTWVEWHKREVFRESL